MLTAATLLVIKTAEFTWGSPRDLTKMFSFGKFEALNGMGACVSVRVGAFGWRDHHW